MTSKDSVQLVFKSLEGESLTEISVDRSSTIASIAKLLAERVPLPAKKNYQLVHGVDVLATGDALKAHVTGETAEIIACVESEDSSDEDSAEGKDKKKKGKDKKSKKSKKKDSKDKGKKKKKGKKGKSSESDDSGAKKRKIKKQQDDQLDIGLTKEEREEKKDWLAEKLDQLRQIRPPLPVEHCLVRAQKEWVEHKRKQKEEEEANKGKDWPPMVHEAMKDAEEEARAAGKSETEIKAAVDKAAGFALKVARDNGLYKDPNDPDEDTSVVPMMFQKRKGLERTLAYLTKDDDK